MSQWIDVLPGSWYFNEVVEASNIYLEDGDSFIKGIPYNVFLTNAPYIYEEIKVEIEQKVFNIEKVIQPTVDNPLFVYINGIQTIYQDVVVETDKTVVTLYTPAPKGSIVSFASYGIPQVDDFKRPLISDITSIEYPKYNLLNSTKYYYNPFYRNNREYLYAYGKQLKRINIESSEWTSHADDIQKLLKKYIGYSTDVYCISPNGVVYLPYSLNGVSCRIVYLYKDTFVKTATENFKPLSNKVVYINRFFPNTLISRAEVFVLINRLRETFYSRYTDTSALGNRLNTAVTAFAGQRAVEVGGKYPAGDKKLEVYLNGKKRMVDIDYSEFDNYTVLFSIPLKEGDIVSFKHTKVESDRLSDVGTNTKYYRTDKSVYININGTVDNDNPDDDSWWASHVLALENEVLQSSENMVNGIPVKGIFEVDGIKAVPVNANLDPIEQGEGGEYWFMPNTFMTRAEAITILNRFRKLCMEKFL